MAGTKLKFKKTTETIPSRGSKKQGLKGKKVKLAGNKKKVPEFKYLKTGKSSFPGPEDDVFANLARGDEDGASYSSMSSSASSMVRNRKPRPQKREDFSDLESMSSLESASTGRYSGSSLGSSGGSVPLDKSFAALRDAPPTNPYGLNDAELEEAEKQDILARLAAMRARGVKLSKNYTMRSSLRELQTEMGRIEHEQETARSVQRLRRWLLAGVSGVQYATNTKYSPKFAKGKLNGFSEFVLNSIEDFDPVFERMSERYSGVIGIGNSGNPVVDLFMLLGSQIVMFLFMQHKAGVKPPSEDELKKQHPDMIRNLAREMAVKMREEEKTQEARIRQEELQRLSQYQRQARETYQDPIYQPPPERPHEQPMVQQRVMPGPSFHLPLDIGPSAQPRVQQSEMVDAAAPDMYDVLTANPEQQETVEGLHQQTVPTQEWVPSEMHSAALQAPLEPQNDQEEEAPPLPEYEPVETFPKPPESTSLVKMIEMPVKGMNTRRGKPVKINQIPAEPKDPSGEEGKQVIQIT